MIRRSIPLFLSTAIFAASGYLLNVVLARMLGPVDYGSVGLTLSIISLASVVLTSGVPQVISRAVASDEGAATTTLWFGLRAQARVVLALVLLVVLTSPLLGVLLNRERLLLYLVLIALMLPGYGLMTGLAGYWNGRHRFGRQAALVAVYALGKLACAVSLAVLLGPVGAILGYVVAPLFGSVVGRVALPPPAMRPRQTTSQMVVAAAPLITLALATLLMYSVDLYLVAGLEKDPAAAGYYVVAQSVALIPLTGLAAVSQVATPTVARAVSDGRHADARRLVASTLGYQILLVTPVVLILVLAARPIVTFLYGTSFTDAVEVVQVLVPSYAVVALLVFLTNSLTGAGAGRAAARSAVTGLLLTAAAGAVLTPRLGATGAAAGLAVGASVALLLALVAIHRALPRAPIPARRAAQ